MVNWHSNVFPGILGRTCDRPCEPACRRGRVETEPVAICRLKRVAADYKGDITARLPIPPRHTTGRRVACVGAGPASLTVARDLALAGHAVTVFDARSAGGRLHPLSDPALPASRKRDRRRGGLHPGPRRGGTARPARGQPAGPARRRLRCRLRRLRRAPRARPARAGTRGSGGQHPYRARLARLGQLRACESHRPARARARRRQHGHGLLPLRAPPRRRGRARRRAQRLRGDEGVPLGKGGRDARGHPDPQLPRAEGVHRTPRDA